MKTMNFNWKMFFAIVLALLVMGLALGEHFYLDVVFTEMEEKMEAIDVSEEVRYDDIKELENWWLGKHRFLEIVVPHVQINDITFTFGELLGAIIADDQPSAIAQFYRLKTTVSAVSEMYGFRAGNVF